MIQILGKDSAAKRHFVYSLAALAAMHYGQYEIYSEHYVWQAEDYTDALTVYPLRDYRGQEECLLEAETPAAKQEQAGQVVCYLTPYKPEIEAFLEYIAKEKPEKLTVVYGRHIRESALGQKYLSRQISEKSENTQFELLTVEWDKLDQLVADEALFDGYYQLEPLSGDYKAALLRLLEQMTGTPPKQSKKYFSQERRLRP